MLLDSGKPSGKNMLYSLVTLSLAGVVIIDHAFHFYIHYMWANFQLTLTDSRAFSEFSSLLSTHTSTVYGLTQRDRSL